MGGPQDSSRQDVTRYPRPGRGTGHLGVVSLPGAGTPCEHWSQKRLPGWIPRFSLGVHRRGVAFPIAIRFRLFRPTFDFYGGLELEGTKVGTKACR